MTPRIEKAIDIFLDALNNNTLSHHDCTKCAVGSLVANGMGLNSDTYNETTLERYGHTYINWTMLFSTPDRGKRQRKTRNADKIFEKFPIIKKQIESTDFTWQELAIIEKEFEKHNTGFNSRDSQIKGLEAVVKAMLKFDEQKDDVKAVFTNKTEKQLICN